MNTEESTKVAFKSAFADALSLTAGQHFLSHEDLLGARAKLFMLAQDAFEEVFPKVLYDALETHRSDPITGLDAFYIISCLNVLGRTRDHELTRSERGQAEATRSVRSDENLRRARQKMFERFTNQQAQAIYQWLECAKTWSAFELEAEELEEAQRYWRERSQSS
jgi:hypothetical protein